MRKTHVNYFENILCPKYLQHVLEKFSALLRSFSVYNNTQDSDSSIDLLNIINSVDLQEILKRINHDLTLVLQDSLEVLIKINNKLMETKGKKKKNTKKKLKNIDGNNDEDDDDQDILDDNDIIKSGKYFFKKYIVDIKGFCQGNNKLLLLSISNKKNIIINSILFSLIYMIEMQFSKLNKIQYTYDDKNNVHYILVVI